ncbi:hypothetical protein [Aquimarina muelleri]|uniref:Uncharacterized protein n=1 Tax=Aquimarina muelleri TaxID=279356 RepID=A0A918JUG7_9FLAO|nr:hypothetical protein [Aquimarina muelleri]MCX2761970.1 hypothetical protein [Aquimarina muelleri]GGX10755.1 hypothetical protein GCM10007384_10610 [Aquimarina muelleri]
MERKLKLIWDFKGPNASKTAQHHEIHLKEYIHLEETSLNITGYQDINEIHSIAFMIVTDSEMKKIRDALKPHRGQVYED